MTTQGKENGENLLDHYVEEIITDSKLVHEDNIIIDDFAKYLMSKWLIMIQLKVTLMISLTYFFTLFSNSGSKRTLVSILPLLFIQSTFSF